MSFSGWVKCPSIQWNIHSAIKKEQRTDTCCSVNEPWKHYSEWKKPVVKNHIFYIVWLHLCEMCRVGNYIETESRLVVAKSLEPLGKIGTDS